MPPPPPPKAGPQTGVAQTLPAIAPLPARKRVRFGYLLPEFPGQTHSFFWREATALRKLGFDAELISTRRPDRSIICHDWAQEAMARTTYLWPSGVAGAARAGTRVLTRVRGALACRAAMGALGGGAKSRARMVCLAAMGARLAALSARAGLRHIHIHSCADAAFIGAFSRMLGGPTYSLTLHGGVWDYGPGQALKWQHAEFGIIIARALWPGLREAVPALDESRVSVAPMGVEVEKFVRAVPYEPAPARGRIRVVTCGRLHPCKGHADLVRGAAILRDGGMDIEVRIIGEGDERGAIEREAAELGMQNRVRLLGAVPERVVKEELEHAHVFALASLWEPLGVATMEAMAMGLPVVVTGNGGVPELVRHGVDGLLVASQKPRELAAALETVLRDPDLARRLGESGAERVRGQFHSGVSAVALAQRLAALPTLAG